MSTASSNPEPRKESLPLGTGVNESSLLLEVRNHMGVVCMCGDHVEHLTCYICKYSTKAVVLISTVTTLCAIFYLLVGTYFPAMFWFAYICFWISDWEFGTWGDFVCMCVCVCAHPLPFGPAFFAGLCCCVTYGWDRSVRADELGGDSHMLAAWASKGSVLLCVVGPPAESTRKREVESEKASSLSTFIREHRRSVQHSLDPRPLIRFLTARFTRAFISRGVTNSMWQAVCVTRLNARSHTLHGNCLGIRSSLPPRNIPMALGQAVNYDRDYRTKTTRIFIRSAEAIHWCFC